MKITFFTQMLLVESAAAVGLCCTHNAHVRRLPERKIVICDVFDSVCILL